jgi:hypothetical protein
MRANFLGISAIRRLPKSVFGSKYSAGVIMLIQEL